MANRPEGYRWAVEWIAINDEVMERDVDVIATFISTALLADMWHKDTKDVAKDILRFREKNNI